MKTIFVTGIGTDVGKTVVSAIIAESLKADYWKPVQTGNSTSTDSIKIKNWISNEQTKIHPEAYSLRPSMSPHAAAELEGVSIELKNIHLPETNNNIVIEGAGGLMVPLNEKEFMIDIINKFDSEIVLVVQNYLGSINHSLLSIDAIKFRKLKILGIIFNGAPHKLSEDIILSYSGLKCLGRISKEQEINKEVVSRYSKQIVL